MLTNIIYYLLGTHFLLYILENWEHRGISSLPGTFFFFFFLSIVLLMLITNLKKCWAARTYFRSYSSFKFLVLSKTTYFTLYFSMKRVVFNRWDYFSRGRYFITDYEPNGYTLHIIAPFIDLFFLFATRVLLITWLY